MVLLFSYMYISSRKKDIFINWEILFQYDLTKIVIKAHISFYMSKQKLIQKRGVLKKNIVKYYQLHFTTPHLSGNF